MFVDESFSALESIKWIFKDEPYYLFAFDSPIEALSVMKALKFSVVVADQSMREMDGIEFFERAKQKSPDTLGIILTSYLDFDKALEALDKGLVNRFIKKPWNCIGLKQAVKTAVENYETNAEGKVFQGVGVPQPVANCPTIR
jgi:DNA-binding NtrC family response regulator